MTPDLVRIELHHRDVARPRVAGEALARALGVVEEQRLAGADRKRIEDVLLLDLALAGDVHRVDAEAEFGGGVVDDIERLAADSTRP